jgi:hypothetical protein
MGLLKKMKQHGIPVHSSTPKNTLRIFEDNSGDIEMARTTNIVLAQNKM